MPVLLVTHYDDDDSWSFQSGHPVTMADAQVVAMKTVYRFDPTIVEIADLEPGWSAERKCVGGPWIRFQEEPEPENQEAEQPMDANLPVAPQPPSNATH